MCSNLELSTEVVSMLQKQNDFLFKQMTQLKQESVKLHRLIQLNRWGHKLFSKDEDTLEYLTGCSSYTIFASLVHSLATGYPSNLRLSPANQLFLTLMKVKLYVPDCYLKQLFHGVNVMEVLGHWLPKLESTLSRLVVWPLHQPRMNYILSYFNIRFSLQVGVVFTESGSICYITQILPSVTEKLLYDRSFLKHMHPGDRLTVVQTQMVYKAIKTPEGLSFVSISKKPTAIPTLNEAKGAIEAALEKVRGFAIFSGNVGEFRHMNLLVQISAALVNLNQGHVPDISPDDVDEQDCS